MAADNGALAAYPLEAVAALRVAGPIVRGLILDRGLILTPILTPTVDDPLPPMQPTMLVEAETEFEFWLLERWLSTIRSPAFQQSAKCSALRAHWERER